MKKLIVLTAILITGFITSAKSETKYINHSHFEFGFFYSNLSPYGTWIEIDHGLIVWRPTIIRKGWAPYRHGRWLWTVDGWYWDSYEPFGHIVFHYGRWYYDDYYGWIWIPDYDWAPAWVEWRYDDYYIGWAPLAPYAVFSIHIGIHYTHSYYVPHHHWHFVKYGRFYDPYVYNYYVAPKYKYRVYNSTKYRNNYGYRNGRIVNNGVDINHIRKRSGQDIKQRDIIRVNDYKEAEKYRGKEDNVVRTFVASRDELSKTRSNDIKIERTDKRSTIDVSKVRLNDKDLKEKKTEVNNKERSAGRDTEIRKNTDSRNEVLNKERNNNSEIKRKNEVEIKRNESTKTEKKNNDLTPVKKIERNDDQKRETNVKTEVNRNTEVKRENTNKSINEQQRKDVQRKEVNTQKNNDVKVKTEVKRESSNNKTIVEQKRQENKTQVRTEEKRNNNVNKNETQNKKIEHNKNSDNNTNKRSR